MISLSSEQRLTDLLTAINGLHIPEHLQGNTGWLSSTEIHSALNGAPLRCPRCGGGEVRSKGSHSHKINPHEPQYKDYKCLHCNRSFLGVPAYWRLFNRIYWGNPKLQFATLNRILTYLHRSGRLEKQITRTGTNWRPMQLELSELHIGHVTVIPLAERTFKLEQNRN